MVSLLSKLFFCAFSLAALVQASRKRKHSEEDEKCDLKTDGHQNIQPVVVSESLNISQSVPLPVIKYDFPVDPYVRWGLYKHFTAPHKLKYLKDISDSNIAALRHHFNVEMSDEHYKQVLEEFIAFYEPGMETLAKIVFDSKRFSFDAFFLDFLSKNFSRFSHQKLQNFFTRVCPLINKTIPEMKAKWEAFYEKLIPKALLPIPFNFILSQMQMEPSMKSDRDTYVQARMNANFLEEVKLMKETKINNDRAKFVKASFAVSPDVFWKSFGGLEKNYEMEEFVIFGVTFEMALYYDTKILSLNDPNLVAYFENTKQLAQKVLFLDGPNKDRIDVIKVNALEDSEMDNFEGTAVPALIQIFMACQNKRVRWNILNNCDDETIRLLSQTLFLVHDIDELPEVSEHMLQLYKDLGVYEHYEDTLSYYNTSF